jgi:lysozyme family protein
VSSFDAAIGYLLMLEGGYSDIAQDHGGATHWGVTDAEATRHGFNVQSLTVDQAKQIFKDGYWKFDPVTDQRVATKMLDMVVNFGNYGGARLIQSAVGVTRDGIFGPATIAAVNAIDPDTLLEKLSLAAGDHYVDIVTANTSQIVFLKGWIRRAIQRPPLA